ncbi:hypothetical protein RJE46_15885 [Cedecea neteri]|uniref:hypothetical protein n=1 Tax=Cedecea neteri TaxID=158822 RepID=UPI001E4B501C|nr:hypothetical protein [Cedecea neteri]WNJ82171.1 hypothetical protein RJE46_15885 [Cedecea neteri]
MSALWIELKKGFTNEGVVHELSWIPGVQTGALLFTIPGMIGIDLSQKSLNRSKRFLIRRAICAFSQIYPGKIT